MNSVYKYICILLFLVIYTIINISISNLLYGDYLLVKKIYFNNEQNKLCESTKLTEQIESTKFTEAENSNKFTKLKTNKKNNNPNDNWNNKQNYLSNPDDSNRLGQIKLKDCNNTHSIKKNVHGLLENNKICLFDIKNKLMVKNYIRQIEKNDIKLYSTIFPKTAVKKRENTNMGVNKKNVLKSNLRSGNYLDLYLVTDTNLNLNSNSDTPMYLCSNPETYYELCYNFLLTKFVVLVLSFGIFLITLSIFDEINEYYKSLNPAIKLPERIETIKLNNNNNEIIV